VSPNNNQLIKSGVRLSSTNKALKGPIQGSLLLRLLPFVVLVLGGMALILEYDSIPYQWPVHWGIDGRPDRWSTKSPMSIVIPLAAGTLLCGFLEMIVLIMRARPGWNRRISNDTAAAIKVLAADLIRTLETGIAMVFVYIGVFFPFSSHVSPLWFVVLVLGVVAGAIVTGMIRFWRGMRKLKRGGHKGLEGYNGLIYRNADDPRLWVPKLTSVGYTLNFAHRWAWLILLFFMLIPVCLIVVLAVT